MRQLLLRTAAGLCLVPLVGPVWVRAAEPPKVDPLSDLTKKAEGCGSFGTSVEFQESPSAAAKQAKKEQKLVFVLHVSGNFEDPRFT
jgi:hypothetical protein